MSNFTAEAIRVTIQHGGFDLEVFQLCDTSLWEQYGQYRLSQSQILERIDEPTNWITELASKKKKILQALQEEGFTGLALKVKFKEEGGRGWKTAKTLSIPDSTEIWWHFSSNNKKAKSILKASTEETIERRADAKFNQIRTEEEYESRTKVRMEGKQIRHSLTDAIKWYVDNHEVSDNKRRWIYHHCSEAANIGLFGRKASKLCVDFGVADNSMLRDSLTADELRWLTEIEDLAARLILFHNYEPHPAVKEAIERLAILRVDRTA